jgi:hypothetical protein
MGATMTRTPHAEARPDEPGAGVLHRALIVMAGPALIVACVAFALRGFIFQDRLTTAHPDILTFWLPRFSFLGRSLAAGHLPLWNPFEMSGARFAADPQSGWLSVVPMTLFTGLSPAAAMRAMIVVHPLIAGLGLYAFLRIESSSRLAATMGALSLAMMMATSEIVVSMPFAGSLAWTTITLTGAAGYRRADRWSRRIAWLALGAAGWAQVATSHMSHGLVICTILLVAYLMVGAIGDVRSRSASVASAFGRALLFVGVLPVAGLAVLIPRMDALRGSSLAAGYDRLGDALGSLGGGTTAIQANGVWAAWPLGFGSTPGAYAGAAILLAVPLALRARRHRALLWAFGGALGLTWFAMLDVVVTNPFVRAVMLRIPFGDVYLHNPGRMRYLALIAIPVLGAIGIQGLRDDPLPATRAMRWLGACAAFWLVVPLIAGASPLRLLFLAVASIVAGTAIWALATKRTTLAWAGVGAVLTLELLGSAIWSQLTPQGETVRTGMEGGEHPNLVPQPLPLPEVDASEFMTPTAFVPRLQRSQDRYLTWAPPASFYEKGYLFMQEASDRPALAMERGSLFGMRDVLGYNPLQLPRYWDYMRARTDLPLFYNAAVIDVPTPEDARLLGLRYLVVPSGIDAPLPSRIIDRAQGYDLVELNDAQPMVSVVPEWLVLGTPADAIGAVLETGFDPAATAVLETDPGIQATAGAAPGRASWNERSPEDIQIDVEADADSIVVVRSSYDDSWTATVDGRVAPVLPTDGFLLGVAVPKGEHQVQLTYLDRTIGRGLLASASVWVGLGIAFVTALLVEQRPRRHGWRERVPAPGDGVR